MPTTISITRLGLKRQGFSTRAVLFECKNILLMEYIPTTYGALDWVCVDIKDKDFDWLTWLEEENSTK